MECGAQWADDRSRGLSDLLFEKGYLTVSAREALDGRFLPWGNWLNATYGNFNVSHETCA